MLHPNHPPSGKEWAAAKKEYDDFVNIVEVDPPMFGNAFRINLGCGDKACSGRFDLRAQKLEIFDPRTPQFALLDLGGTLEHDIYVDSGAFLTSNTGISP